jgi:sulfite reductase (NADPH) flavoprotein alpha-component
MKVFFGTETGNSETVAKSIIKKAAKNGLEAEGPVSLDGYTPEQLAEESRVIIVISTWDQGEPPEAARDFCEELFETDAVDLSGVEFCVIALGDPEYDDDFCRCGLMVDEHLERLGATRLMECAKLGVDFQVSYMGWSKNFYKMLEGQAAA